MYKNVLEGGAAWMLANVQVLVNYVCKNNPFPEGLPARFHALPGTGRVLT